MLKPGKGSNIINSPSSGKKNKDGKTLLDSGLDEQPPHYIVSTTTVQPPVFH